MLRAALTTSSPSTTSGTGASERHRALAARLVGERRRAGGGARRPPRRRPLRPHGLQRRRHDGAAGRRRPPRRGRPPSSPTAAPRRSRRRTCAGSSPGAPGVLPHERRGRPDGRPAADRRGRHRRAAVPRLDRRECSGGEGPRLLRKLVSPSQRAFWKQAHGDDWPDVVAADAALLLELADRGGWDPLAGRLGDVRCPVLLTSSLGDEELPSVVAQHQHLAMEIADCRLWVTPRGGHPAMWSGQARLPPRGRALPRERLTRGPARGTPGTPPRARPRTRPGFRSLAASLYTRSPSPRARGGTVRRGGGAPT